MPTADQVISKIAVAIDPTDSKTGGRWAAPTGRPIVERAEPGNAAVDAFCLTRIRGFLKSLPR